MTNKEENAENKNTKEDFCGACVAVPLAMAGLGAAAGSDLQSKKKWKKVIFFSGIAISLISIGVAIWYLAYCKSCTID
jgi:hypothetical protein